MLRLTAPIQFILNFSRKMRDDHVSSFAAEATLFIVISAFPFIMFLLSLIEYLPITSDALVSLCDALLPSVLSKYTDGFFDKLMTSSSGTMVATTAIAFLWAGSKGFLSLERGLNCIYSRMEQRNYFLRRLLSLVYTIIFALFIILLMVVFVFGNQLFTLIIREFPKAEDLAVLIRSIRTIVGLILLVLLFTSMYKFIPNRRGQHSSFLTELPGALITAFGWIGFSFLYSFYIDNMSNFSVLYGNLTAIVLCLLWLYVCIYILFFGAEINGLLKLYEIRALMIMHKKKHTKVAPVVEPPHEAD